MKLTFDSELGHLRGPFSTICMDVSRIDESARHELEKRWAAYDRELEALGAPRADRSAMGDAVLAPPHGGGPQSRLVVAANGQIVLDEQLPGRPRREEFCFGPAPHLLPAARALADRVVHVVAKVDRSGATVEVRGMRGEPERFTVQGDHDVLHKVPGGGTAHRKIQARVEDSVGRNADEVAASLRRVVNRYRPELLFLAGDEKAISALLHGAGDEVTAIAVRIPSGGRAPGSSDSALENAIAARIADHRQAQRREVLDRFRAAEARQDLAVQGYEAVVDALRRGQVQELLLRDDGPSESTVWMGADPHQIGTGRSDVEALAAQDPQRVRADAGMVWTALACDGGITLVDQDEPRLVDGVGALLRWSDRSTPHDAIPSMPGHGDRPGERRPSP